MAKYMTELGLTPASRSRLAIQMNTGTKPREYDGITEVTRINGNLFARQSAGQGDPHRILTKFIRPDCAHTSSPLMHNML